MSLQCRCTATVSILSGKANKCTSLDLGARGVIGGALAGWAAVHALRKAPGSAVCCPMKRWPKTLPLVPQHGLENAVVLFSSHSRSTLTLNNDMRISRYA